MARLYLADGSPPVEGRSFGAPASCRGEVVFNTGMVGYPEALTDPSYRGQILVLTYPLVGNYGVPDASLDDAHGLPRYFESRQIHIAGLVVSSYSWEHSHWAAHQSLATWLRQHDVPAMYGVDTRALTMKIRNSGALLGSIVVVSRSSRGRGTRRPTGATLAEGEGDGRRGTGGEGTAGDAGTGPSHSGGPASAKRGLQVGFGGSVFLLHELGC